MTFEIKEIHEDGSGYMVVTRDDGSTFGQMFKGLPVNDEVAAKDYLSALAQERDAAPEPVKAVDVKVLELKDKPVLVTRKQLDSVLQPETLQPGVIMPTLILCFALVAALFAAPAHAVIMQQDDGAFPVPGADVTVTGSATLVAAANANRATLNCTNNSGSVNVRWGNSTVTASTGQRIPFSTAIEIRSRGAIYMISEGVNVTVSCTEENR
jgi:hypothetical protein